MTNPTQGVSVRRAYYGSGTPPVLPVLYDDQYDANPSTDVLDPVLQYDGARSVIGYTWNGTRQVEDDSDPTGDALRTSAVAYWKLDETSGTRVDSTGNGNDLNQVNQDASAAGKVSNAVSLTMESSYIRRSSDTSFAFGDVNYAFAFWIYFNSLPTALSGNESIFEQNDPGVSAEYYFYISDFDPGIVLVFEGVGFSLDSSTFGDISASTWYFVVAEYDTTLDKVRMYINDGAAMVDDIFSPSVATGNRFLLGKGESISTEMDGRIDEFLVINRLTTAAERTYLYNGGNGRTLYP